MILLIIPIILFAFFLRVISWKEVIFSTDVPYHLLVAEAIKEQGRNFSLSNYFVGPTEQTYPTFFHYILSLPIRVLSTEKIMKYLGPFLDCINLLLLFIFISTVYSQIVGIISGLLYAVIPIAVENSISPNPRILGVFFTNLCIFSLWIAINTLSPVFLISSVFSLSILIVTHKSSTQVLLGTLVFLGIILMNTLHFLIIIGIIVLAIFIVTMIYRKKFVIIVKDRFRFWKEYPPGFFKPLAILANLPLMIGLFLLFINLMKIFADFNILQIDLVIPFSSPFITFSLLYLLGVILVYTFDIWGRSGIYLVHASAVSCFLSGVFLTEWVSLGFGFFGLVTMVSISFILSLFARKRFRSNAIVLDAQITSTFDELTKMEKPTVMCIPSRYCYSVAYFSKQKVLYGNVNVFSIRLGLELTKSNEELLKGNYQLVEGLIETYMVSHILLDSNRFDRGRLQGYQKLAENGPYIIFRT